MRKLREDSLGNKLTLEQRDLLEHWLFDDNLGYTEARERVQKEFGLETTVWSVSRFFHQRARERPIEQLVEASVSAGMVNATPISTASLREAAVKLAGKSALKLAGEKPNDMDHLVAFTRLLLESEENEIRRERLRLSQRQFDHAAMASTIEELPQLRSYLITVSDDGSLTEMEKLERIRAIILGKDNPNAIIRGTVPVQPFPQEIRDLHPDKCRPVPNNCG
jgi:hypothetical protein